MSLELTTRTGITCPSCGKEFEVKTKGLFGGILKQAFLHTIIDAIKKNSKGRMKVTCGKCGHEFIYEEKGK